MQNVFASDTPIEAVKRSDVLSTVDTKEHSAVQHVAQLSSVYLDIPHEQWSRNQTGTHRTVTRFVGCRLSTRTVRKTRPRTRRLSRTTAWWARALVISVCDDGMAAFSVMLAPSVCREPGVRRATSSSRQKSSTATRWLKETCFATCCWLV